VDGALADVATPTGAIRLPVSLCRDLQPGTVAVPHGWGHQKAKGLSFASTTRAEPRDIGQSPETFETAFSVIEHCPRHHGS
jgi:anaerobic selenocysteine-containing dehydrogenase